MPIASGNLGRPGDDGDAFVGEVNGEPEVEAAGQMARVPDVGHEDIGGVLLEDEGALCTEGFVSRHIAIACGDAREG